MARVGSPDWHRLIPSLKGYLVPGPTAPEEYSLLESSLEVALGYSELFWPSFHKYDGMVFRGSAEDQKSPEDLKNIASWIAKFNGDRSKVEEMLNHEHLVDLFFERNRKGTGHQVYYLGSVLRETWQAKLMLDFPEKQFVVELHTPGSDGSGDYEIGDWILTFYQKPSQG